LPRWGRLLRSGRRPAGNHTSSYSGSVGADASAWGAGCSAVSGSAVLCRGEGVGLVSAGALESASAIASTGAGADSASAGGASAAGSTTAVATGSANVAVASAVGSDTDSVTVAE